MSTSMANLSARAARMLSAAKASCSFAGNLMRAMSATPLGQRPRDEAQGHGSAVPARKPGLPFLVGDGVLLFDDP
eukprot:7634076-Pyramimonas_sp.AAC.1